MAKIDEIKEELNYLKVWLGIVVVTNIGLVSWLINNYNKDTVGKVLLDIFSILLLTITIVVIDKKIKAKIKTLRDL